MEVFTRYSLGGRTILIIGAILLVLAGYLYGKETTVKSFFGSTACHQKYNLLDQSIDCEKNEDAQMKILSLEERINAYVERSKIETRVSRAGIFYRDLTTRRWFSINADAEFYPASLAKLPLAITYHKLADLKTGLFDQKLTLDILPGYTNEGQRVSVESPMQAGTSYSVKDMIDDMIIYSDNRPIGPLITYVSRDVWSKVYVDLGVLHKNNDGTETLSVTPRSIALIFRALFNASYLTPEASQELLTTMTHTRYDKALVAGVEQGVVVAHKFGETTTEGDSGVLTSALHDCGIVYKPGKPYILCVMTEGKNFQELEKTIAEISSIVYQAQ